MAQEIRFSRDVRPILSAECFQCHGPDGEHRKAGLRFDLREVAFGALKDGGFAIVPGKVAQSELVRRITSSDPKVQMPPPDSGRNLDAEQRQILTDWIEQGARWSEHWAFSSPLRPAVPSVLASDRGYNEVDGFVLARLHREGLSASPEADKLTLIRRVTLDLTGLPPTLEEIDAFASDDAPGSYERLVDRLLGCDRYGEHMSRFWLDAARYGDTHGLHLDNYREMWPYRDWVIGAFNQNMPFDRFTIEQIAGDLLPNATLKNQIASGFNRCHVTTNEGGSINEEVYVRNVVDRVSTTGTVFMGLTVGCAVCHDHKFDPITQAEFYQLFAFFNNLDGKAMDGNNKVHAPVVKVPTDEHNSKMSELSDAVEAIGARITAELASVQYEEPPSEPAADAGLERRTIVWVDDEFPQGAKAEGDGLVWGAAPAHPVHSGKRSMKRSSKGNQQHFFRNAATKLRIGSGDRLFAWVHLDPKQPPREIMLQFNSDGAEGWKHRAFWGENLIKYGKTGTTERVRMGPLPATGKWIRLQVDVARIGLRPGMIVHGVAFAQFDGTAYWDTVGIESTLPQEPQDFVWIDDDVPSAAVLGGDGGKTWQWGGGKGHPVHSGLRSLKRKGGGGLNQDYFTGARPLKLQRGDRLFAHVWLDPKDPPRSVQLQFNNGKWEHRARWGAPAHGGGRKGGADYAAGPLPAKGRWVRLEVELDKVALKPGEQLNGWAFTQVGGTAYWDRAGVKTWGIPDDRHLQSQLAWEQRSKGDGSLPKTVRAALGVGAQKRSKKQVSALRHHYLRHVYGGTRQAFDPLEAELAVAKKKVTDLEKATPTTLVMKELAKPRPAYLLKRGQYDARGPKVERLTPAFLPPMADGLARDRMGLARWLVDPAHPLTARVTVNRYWQQLFGVGLVKTSEDFGNQGEPPSHPLLLDWLATQFIANGWDVKKTIKRMVMSASYRQSSRVDASLAARDPENRFFARGPRFRLDAEMLRDQALALSGLLVRKIGGPGVKPPQPDGLWFAVGYSGSNTVRFKPDKGPEKVHRRSLYTFWKRTAPPPQMSAMDAPSREVCSVRRERTNTPLQALLMMNDPQYVEAARHLAQRVLREGGAGSRDRLLWSFRLVTGHPPSADDLADLDQFLSEQLAVYTKDLKSAQALIAIGDSKAEVSFAVAELAAWTMVANLLLNLDEVVTKG